jgi:hypothetical protein
MNKMKIEDVSQLEEAASEQNEDPKMRAFTVKNPVKT